MKHLPHLAIFGGMLLSILISDRPLLCVLLGLALPLLSMAVEIRQRDSSRAPITPYAPNPIVGPGPRFYLLLGFAMLAVAAYIWTRFLPLPEALARRPIVAGGLYYTLGAILSVGLIFFHLAWSMKRGAAQ